MKAGIHRSGVALGGVVSVLLTVWILVGMRGWAYYTTPLAVRGYAPSHALLRPSGPVGQSLGIVGAVMILMPFAYMLRKRIRGSSMGSPRLWLEVHLFCGIVGPVLVTFHTSFKFNGIVSAAYWSMVLVMTSGFVGRYLYVRIPRSLRGVELTRAELDARAEALHEDLVVHAEAAHLVEAIEALERQAVPSEERVSWMGLLFGEIGVRRSLRALTHRIARSGLEASAQEQLRHLATERVLLLRRGAYLRKTKLAFGLWHVFHLPLVYILLVIVALHVGLAVYLGYVPFRWT